MLGKKFRPATGDQISEMSELSTRPASKHVTMHTLRHTATMRLLLAGNDVTVIALWLGHEQISTTNVYLHADMTHKQQAIDRTNPPTPNRAAISPPTRS
jgi:integrase/recombinase XerD